MDKLKVAVLAGDIWDEFNRFYDDAKKLIDKGNKSAGKRSRVSTNKLTKLFKEWRRLTLEADNER